MKTSLLKAYYGKELNEQDYNNLSDLMLIPILIVIVCIIF